MKPLAKSLPTVVALSLIVFAWTACADEAPQPRPSATTGPRPKPIDPPSAEQIDAAVHRGVDFLIAKQNDDGSWGSHRRTKGLNIYAPVPGGLRAFHCGTTALCVAALCEIDDPRPEAQKALAGGEAWLIERLPQLRRGSADALYNTWAHAYGIQAYVRMHRRADDDARREQLAELIAGQIDRLGRYEFLTGGWGYYDFNAHTQRPSGNPTSFTTATALVALYEARQIGVEVPQGMIDRAIRSIQRQRNGDFTYAYADRFDLLTNPMHPVNRRGGSLGRSQACNVALRLWDDPLVTDEVLTTWLDRLFARNLWLDIGRKRPIPHESWFAVAGYFFYYGHYYAALCIEQLPPDERGHCQDHLAHLIVAIQEKDGSWWDYPLYDYHQPYGTAFALMTLDRCRRE